MMIKNLSSNALGRRRFLQMSAGLAGLGAAAPFALQLTAAGQLAAATATDYKALVCIFMYGGNDANNMVMATDQDSYNRYWAARFTGDTPIALMPVGAAKVAVGATSPITGRVVADAFSPEAWGGMLPIVPKTAQAIPAGTSASTRTFAIHPMMGPMQSLFNANRVAVLANVGTLIQPVTRKDYENNAHLPPNLFSHNDQQNMWQAGGIEGTEIGWGGKLADMILSGNGANSIFTALTTAGNTVFLSGENTLQYPMNVYGDPAQRIDATTGWLYGGSGPSQQIRLDIRNVANGNYFADDHAGVVTRSMAATDLINSAFNKTGPKNVLAVPGFVNPFDGTKGDSYFMRQLAAVAKMVAAAPLLGVKRQVFLVSMGGFDTHDGQNQAQPSNMAELSQGLAYFDAALSNINGADMRSAVTSFTASDFSRTFVTNGDGTDHAWSGHHFIHGGAVKGRDMYGQFPTVGVDGHNFRNPDIADNAMIPTTSVDQYAATLGKWFGVADGDLHTIFPNLHNYSTPYLGFV